MFLFKDKIKRITKRVSRKKNGAYFDQKEKAKPLPKPL